MNKDNINEFASFDEYLRQGEPLQKERAENWKTAIGLQAVDGLQPSAYLIDVAKRNIEGDSVNYLNWEDLRRALDWDIEQEKNFQYKGLSDDEKIEHIAKFISGIWQIHAFREGNTRTTAIFTIQYLRSLGYEVNNEMFAKHSWYFRNALVRANYRNIQKGIDYSPIYLVRFFRNLLLKDGWVLKNRYLHIRPTDDWKEQPNLNSQTGSGQKNNFINKEGEENVPSSSQACPKFVPSSSQVEELIIRINKDYLSIGDIMNLFGLKNRTRFRKEYITPALAEGALEMKYPNTPRHPRQQYRMTELAKTWKEWNEKKNK